MARDAAGRFEALTGASHPIIQAPMAGVSTPAMAAAVSEAGAVGSIGIGATDAAGAREMIGMVRRHTERRFNVNVFCHRPARMDAAKGAAWSARLAPEFGRYGATAPTALREIYRSFLEDDDVFRTLLDTRPGIVSFHFGVPGSDRIRALREVGTVLMGAATNLAEARALAAAGIDVVVAQGYEAGGHRGLFDPDAPDDRLGTLALTRLLVRDLSIPVVAAGGIMDGAGIAAVLRLGAAAAQLGTAFVTSAESAADDGYRAAFGSDAVHHTIMTRAISGRPARCLANTFTRLGAGVRDDEVPDYPLAYDIGKALHAAAKKRAEHGYGAHWAGQGAPMVRSMPAADLVRTLVAELARAA